MAVKISNCGHDENDRYSGGKAGDQSGTEWYIRSWYNGGWKYVLRHPDSKVANLLAEMAEAAAKNNNIGYDQSQRETFWQQLKLVGYKPEKITKKCEADCSSGVAAIVKGAGYRLGNKKMQGVSPSVYTGNEKAALKAAGFAVLTGASYTASTSKLKAGDILLSNSHTTIVVSGTASSGGGTSSGSTSGKLTVDGLWGKNTTKALQKALGTPVDGIVDSQCIDWKAKNPGLTTGWDWQKVGKGSKCIKALQKLLGVTQDGVFGEKSINALIKALKDYSGATEYDGKLDKPSITIKAMQKLLNDGKLVLVLKK